MGEIFRRLALLWHRRSLPAQLRALGPPHAIGLMNAIADMVDPDVELHGPRGELLAQALDLLLQAARLDVAPGRPPPGPREPPPPGGWWSQ